MAGVGLTSTFGAGVTTGSGFTSIFGVGVTMGSGFTSIFGVGVTMGSGLTSIFGVGVTMGSGLTSIFGVGVTRGSGLTSIFGVGVTTGSGLTSIFGVGVTTGTGLTSTLGVGVTTGAGLTSTLGSGLTSGVGPGGVPAGIAGLIGRTGAGGGAAGVGIGFTPGFGGIGTVMFSARTRMSLASTTSRPRFLSNFVEPMTPTYLPVLASRSTEPVTHCTYALMKYVERSRTMYRLGAAGVPGNRSLASRMPCAANDVIGRAVGLSDWIFAWASLSSCSRRCASPTSLVTSARSLRRWISVVTSAVRAST